MEKTLDPWRLHRKRRIVSFRTEHRGRMVKEGFGTRGEDEVPIVELTLMKLAIMGEFSDERRVGRAKRVVGGMSMEVRRVSIVATERDGTPSFTGHSLIR